jgi:hypothetical protein
MVTRDSATCFMPEEEVHNQIAIIADHSRLVKFEVQNDENYLRVLAKMSDMVEQHSM